MSISDVKQAVRRAGSADDLVVDLALLQANRWRSLAVELKRRSGGDRGGFAVLADEFEGAADTVEGLCSVIPKGEAPDDADAVPTCSQCGGDPT